MTPVGAGHGPPARNEGRKGGTDSPEYARKLGLSNWSGGDQMCDESEDDSLEYEFVDEWVGEERDEDIAGKGVVSGRRSFGEGSSETERRRWRLSWQEGMLLVARAAGSGSRCL